MTDEKVSPRVVANKGAQVTVFALGADGLPMVDADGNPVRVTRWVRLTNRSTIAIEERWGSIEKMQAAYAESPQTTIRDVLHIVWTVGNPADPSITPGLTVDQVSEMIDMSRTAEYELALSVALFLAVAGMDPTTAATAYEQGLAAVEAKRSIERRLVEKVAEETGTLIAEAESTLEAAFATLSVTRGTAQRGSTGDSSSPNGPVPDEPGESSGT